MAGYAVQRDISIPEVLTTAWKEVQDQWEDLGRHDELLRLVTKNEAYAWAAARYKTRDDEIGKKQLARVRKAAEVTMLASAAERKASGGPKPYRATTALLVVLVVVAIAGLIYAMVVRDRGATPSPTPATTPATTPSGSGATAPNGSTTAPSEDQPTTPGGSEPAPSGSGS